ncbi:hypothetical protein CHLRE_17g710871v5 [Chlamydomonas reinhardtii]|uniref:Uncharacterized protein n=1 Tax=Chlamydomonas reinhardtii TaxID=3055 RepID=A0A2K3CPJ9_CHLRE|nr:uncharacterized protein CHLRE_17g710871v5 [Chlamydomonas reinhardtii]PNW70221.1 hypothetical protein CHLRE_17g710871v5 [Chlamydomonas reinhardtii]
MRHRAASTALHPVRTSQPERAGLAIKGGGLAIGLASAGSRIGEGLSCGRKGFGAESFAWPGWQRQQRAAVGCSGPGVQSG